METVSLFEGFSSDWLVVAGFIFFLPKIVFGAFALLIFNAERVPFLNRLLGDRVSGLKLRLKQHLGKGSPNAD